MKRLLSAAVVSALSLFTCLSASAFAPTGNANIYNHSGQDLFINTVDHRYFEEITPYVDGPRFGEWALWKNGTAIKVRQSYCNGVDCTGVWFVRTAVESPDNPVPDSSDIPVVWKLMNRTELLYDLAYIRPCFGGGDCNVELTNHGIGVNIYTHFGDDNNWYLLLPWDAASIIVGELTNLNPAAK